MVYTVSAAILTTAALNAASTFAIPIYETEEGVIPHIDKPGVVPGGPRAILLNPLAVPHIVKGPDGPGLGPSFHHPRSDPAPPPTPSSDPLPPRSSAPLPPPSSAPPPPPSSAPLPPPSSAPPPPHSSAPLPPPSSAPPPPRSSAPLPPPSSAPLPPHSFAPLPPLSSDRQTSPSSAPQPAPPSAAAPLQAPSAPVARSVEEASNVSREELEQVFVRDPGEPKNNPGPLHKEPGLLVGPLAPIVNLIHDPPRAENLEKLD